MNAEMNAIKNAYEEAGMSPQEIALDRDLEETAVKACLMQCSSRYRKDCGKEEDGTPKKLGFSDEQHERVLETIYDLAISAEDPHLRGKMAVYVRNDAMGRLEPVKQIHNGGQWNVLMINQQLQKVRELADSAKRTVPTRALELVNS